MAIANPSAAFNDDPRRVLPPSAATAAGSPAQASAVSWGAIVAGGAAAASLSLIMLMLGTGLGLSSVSPWTNEGASATTFGVSTILWLTLTQLVAAGMGGYLAGRLRTRWMSVHSDEVYFRDSAHGFLAWAVASLATAALLTSAIAGIVGGGARVAASAGGAAMSTAAAATAGAGAGMMSSGSDAPATSYLLDTLFRRDPSSTGSSADATTASTAQDRAAMAAEVRRILMNTARSAAMPAEDIRYVGQLVAQRTGLSQQEAERRVTVTYTNLQTSLRDAETAAREAADQARKATAYSALWIFISLLFGAFIASYAATFGGRQRDN